MNEKTKTILNWAVAVVVSVLISLLILFPISLDTSTQSVGKGIQKIGFILAEPFMILTEFVTVNAINQFGGEMSMEGFNSAVTLSLIGVAVIFFIAPTLMVFGHHKTKGEKEALHPMTWHLGTGIVLAAIGFGLFSAIIWSQSKSNIIEASERQHTLDQLQFELIDLYYDAAAEAILPQEKGGGDGSFMAFEAEDGSARTIQLSDLNRYNPQSEFEFVLSENITDSTLTIIGVTNFEGNDPDFKNADGSTGHVQMSLTVNLYEDRPRRFEKENEMLYSSRES